jgi:predicted esterase
VFCEIDLQLKLLQLHMAEYIAMLLCVVVQSYIAEEEKLGIDRSRILVGGFSQGGAVALYSAFSKPQKSLGGIVAMSTWLPLYQTFPAVG